MTEKLEKENRKLKEIQREKQEKPVKLVRLFFGQLLMLMRVKIEETGIGIMRRKRTVELEDLLKLTDELPKHGQLSHAPDSDGRKAKNPHNTPPPTLSFSVLVFVCVLSLSLSLIVACLLYPLVFFHVSWPISIISRYFFFLTRTLLCPGDNSPTLIFTATCYQILASRNAIVVCLLCPNCSFQVTV